MFSAPPATSTGSPRNSSSDVETCERIKGIERDSKKKVKKGREKIRVSLE
jgi:hypothetical protein